MAWHELTSRKIVEFEFFFDELGHFSNLVRPFRCLAETGPAQMTVLMRDRSKVNELPIRG